jgi:hypothetical protein
MANVHGLEQVLNKGKGKQSHLLLKSEDDNTFDGTSVASTSQTVVGKDHNTAETLHFQVLASGLVGAKGRRLWVRLQSQGVFATGTVSKRHNYDAPTGDLTITITTGGTDMPTNPLVNYVDDEGGCP